MLKSFVMAATRVPTHLVKLLDSLMTSVRPSWQGRIRGNAVEALLAHQDTVTHGAYSLTVVTPNALCTYRAASFSEKEPETLEWIDRFVEPEVIWDVGANIGLYSLYAAKRHPNAKIYAFEPSVLNLELLSRNIFLNGLVDSICIVPCPLFSSVGEDTFRLQMADRGGALSAFAVGYGYDNKPLKFNLSYRTLGVSMDDMVGFFGVPQPDQIKMDVDGVEHLILKGGERVLSDTRLKSVLVELNDDFIEQKEMAEATLKRAGLKLADKRRSEAAFDAAAGQVWNNIWVRD
ncbi:FkbM family methyltransferase [Devosia sp. UYZn731]|uniref:FkbM family methyltransferase n=1 Tax=Devosia sp. UYZn731 TaxID=3156345 RepID=UPI003394B2AD